MPPASDNPFAFGDAGPGGGDISEPDESNAALDFSDRRPTVKTGLRYRIRYAAGRMTTGAVATPALVRAAMVRETATAPNWVTTKSRRRS